MDTDDWLNDGAFFFAAVFNYFYKTNPPQELNVCIREQNIKNYLKLLLMANKALSGDKQIKLDKLLIRAKRLGIVEVSKCLTLKEFQQNIYNFLKKYQQDQHNICSIMLSISKYLNMDSSPIKNSFREASKLIKSVDPYFKITELETFEIEDKLSDILNEMSKREKERVEADEMKLGDASPFSLICLKCRTRQAICYAVPCMHPALCQKCFDLMTMEQGTYHLCYANGCNKCVERLYRIKRPNL